MMAVIMRFYKLFHGTRRRFAGLCFTFFVLIAIMTHSSNVAAHMGLSVSTCSDCLK